MNKITIQFALASLIYASIGYAPLSHSSWNQGPTPYRPTSETASLMGLSPELQAHGFTFGNLAPFARLMAQTQKHGTPNDLSALSTLIAENVAIHNLLTEKNERIKVTYGTLAVANKIIEDLYQQIEQLCQQSKTAQRESTTIQEQPTDLVLSIVAHSHRFAIKECELAAFKRHVKNEQRAAEKRERTAASTLSTERAELAHAQQQLAAKKHELATSEENMQSTIQKARHELLAAREREQTLTEELATIKTMLAGTQHELEDIKKHPQILLPLYHFSEDAQPTDPTDLTI